uniref:Uncharacterized protein n=1 Tax=Globodera rostochiensis TaxID=31243 RepID=A0A914ID64_GLORO
MGWPTDCSLPKCFVAFVRSVAPIKLYTVAVSCATTTQHFRAGSSSTSPKTTKPLCSPFTAKWRRRHKPPAGDFWDDNWDKAAEQKKSVRPIAFFVLCHHHQIKSAENDNKERKS